jgi:hypothetical protein
MAAAGVIPPAWRDATLDIFGDKIHDFKKLIYCLIALNIRRRADADGNLVIAQVPGNCNQDQGDDMTKKTLHTGYMRKLIQDYGDYAEFADANDNAVIQRALDALTEGQASLFDVRNMVARFEKALELMNSDLDLPDIHRLEPEDDEVPLRKPLEKCIIAADPPKSYDNINVALRDHRIFKFVFDSAPDNPFEHGLFNNIEARDTIEFHQPVPYNLEHQVYH